MLSITSTLARTAVRRVSTTAVVANEAAATPTAISLSLTLPHATLYENADVHHVVVPAITGDAGINAAHVPTVAELRPGVVAVYEKASDTAASKKFFVSGGFASVNPDSTVDITCAEAVPVSEIDVEKARKALADYTAAAASANNDEARFLAQIGVDVHQALVSAAESA